MKQKGKKGRPTEWKCRRQKKDGNRNWVADSALRLPNYSLPFFFFLIYSLLLLLLSLIFFFTSFSCKITVFLVCFSYKKKSCFLFFKPFQQHFFFCWIFSFLIIHFPSPFPLFNPLFLFFPHYLLSVEKKLYWPQQYFQFFFLEFLNQIKTMRKIVFERRKVERN